MPCLNRDAYAVFPERVWWALAWQRLTGRCWRWLVRVGLWDVEEEGGFYRDGHPRLDFWRTRATRQRRWEELTSRERRAYERGVREGCRIGRIELVTELLAATAPAPDTGRAP